MSAGTYETDLDLGVLGQHEVEVRYEYHPACRGYREPPYGVPLEPDEPEEVELTGISIHWTCPDGKGQSLDVTDGVLTLLSREVAAALEADILDAIREERERARYDAREEV
jgi:hypothetical protein